MFQNFLTFKNIVYERIFKNVEKNLKIKKISFNSEKSMKSFEKKYVS